MPDGSKPYKFNGRIYDIPDNEVDAFLKVAKGAQLVTPTENFLQTVSNPLPGKESVKPVDFGGEEQPTISTAVNQDDHELGKRIMDAMANKPLGQNKDWAAMSPQEKKEQLESQGVKAAPAEAPKGISKVIDDAGTIASNVISSPVVGASKVVSGLGKLLTVAGNPTALADPTFNPGENPISEGAKSVAEGFAPNYKENQEDIQKMAPVTKFVSNAVSGLGELLPAIASAPITGGTSLFFQGYDGASDEIKDADISPALKQTYSMLSGGIFAALNELPIGRALNKTISEKVVRGLALKSLNKAITDAGGKLSFEVMDKALNGAKEALADKVKRFGITGLKNLAEGATFTAADQLSQMGLKAGTNAATGKEVFKPETVSDFAEHLASGTGALAMIQSALGGFGGRTNDYLKQKVAEAKGPEDLASLHQQIDQMAESGKVTPENAKQMQDAINSYAAIKKTLPEMTPEQATGVISKISERDELKKSIPEIQKQIDELNRQKEQVSQTEEPALQDITVKPIDEQIENLNNHLKDAQASIAVKNDEVREAATGQQYKYREKDGVYEKKLGEGEWEPVADDPDVAKGVYELRAPGKEPKKEGGQNAVQEQSPGEVDVRQQAENGEGMGGENQKPEKPAEESKPQKERLEPLKEGESTKIDNWNIRKEGAHLHIDNDEGKPASASTRRRVMKKYADKYDFAKGERSDTKHPDFEFTHPDEAERWTLENTENPTEVAEVFLRQDPTDKAGSTKERMIAEFGIGHITDDSWKRFGDRKTNGQSIAKSYIRSKENGGQPIDKIAKEMSDHYDYEITPEDIVDYIHAHPNNENALSLRDTPIMKDAKDKFRELTGLELTDDLAKKITNENARTVREGNEGGQGKGVEESATTPSKGDREPEESAEAVPFSGEKQYEEVGAKKKKKSSGRISFSPKPDGGKVEPVSKSLERLSKKTKTKFTFMNPGRRRAAGSYSPFDTAVRQRSAGDMDVAAHELGHKLDDQFGVLKDVVKNPDEAVAKELEELSAHGSEPPAKADEAAKHKYRMGEGFAEFLRAHIVNPDEAARRYPELQRLYESKVPKEYRDAVDEFSSAIRRLDFENGTFGDMTKAFVEMEPAKPEGIMAQIFKKTDYAGDFNLNWLDNLSAKFIDPYVAFKKATEYLQGIKGIDKLIPADDPYLLARLLSGESAKFKDFLDNGLRDAKGKVVTGSDGKPITITHLFDFVKDLDPAHQEQVWEQTIWHMIAERTVELSEKLKRSDVLTGIGGGIFKDVDVAKKELDKFKSLPQETQNRILEGTKRYREFADATLQYMRDKGRMSAEQYKLIKDNNVEYVALQRVMKAGADEDLAVFNVNKKTGKLGVKTEVIKAIKGSGREIKNPYIPLLDNLHKAIIESDRNEAMAAFVKLMDNQRGMYDGSEPVPIAEIGRRVSSGYHKNKKTGRVIANSKPPNSITVFIDGKPETWQFNQSVYESLKGYMDSPIGRLSQLAGKMTAILRFGITHFPTFAVRNVVRDFQDYMIKSNRGLKLSDYFGEKSDWSDLAAIGGLNSGYYVSNANAYYGAMKETMVKLAKDNTVSLVNMDLLKKVWHGYENILSRSETRGRVAQYRAAFRKAKNELSYDDYNAMLYAGFHSRDLMDFALMGSEMRWINKWIPFSNAAVQGMRASFKNAKENPLGFATRMALYSVMPQVAVWFWNHRSEEIAKRYEDLPDWRRDLYYNIYVGDRWITIPKPYELGMLAAGIDRGLSKGAGYNDKAFDGYAGQIFQSFSPVGDWASTMGPLAPESQVIFNKDLFRDKEIVPDYEKGKPVEERNNSYSSRFGLAVQKVAGIDARYVDFLVRSHFGYYGNTALKLSNVGRSGDEGVQFALSDVGFFRGPSGTGGKNVQDLVQYAHDHLLTSTKDYREFNKIKEEFFDPDLTAKQRAEVSDKMAEQAAELLKKWKAEEPERKARRAGKKSGSSNKITVY